MMVSRLKKESGQGLVEYSLILVLVAVVVVAVLIELGPIIDAVFHDANCRLNVTSEEPPAECADEPDESLILKNVITDRSTVSEGDDQLELAREGFEEFRDRYDERYESMGEAFGAANESMWELLEILIEWAETYDDDLQSALIMAQAHFGDGNYAAMAAILLEHSETIGEAPSGVWDEIQANLTPHRTRVCFYLSEAELTGVPLRSSNNTRADAAKYPIPEAISSTRAN